MHNYITYILGVGIDNEWKYDRNKMPGEKVE